MELVKVIIVYFDNTTRYRFGIFLQIATAPVAQSVSAPYLYDSTDCKVVGYAEVVSSSLTRSTLFTAQFCKMITATLQYHINFQNNDNPSYFMTHYIYIYIFE